MKKIIESKNSSTSGEFDGEVFKDMDLAERMLRARFCKYEWDELMDNCGVDVTPSILEAMNLYANNRCYEMLKTVVEKIAVQESEGFNGAAYETGYGKALGDITTLIENLEFRKI